MAKSSLPLLLAGGAVLAYGYVNQVVAPVTDQAPDIGGGTTDPVDLVAEATAIASSLIQTYDALNVIELDIAAAFATGDHTTIVSLTEQGATLQQTIDALLEDWAALASSAPGALAIQVAELNGSISALRASNQVLMDTYTSNFWLVRDQTPLAYTLAAIPRDGGGRLAKVGSTSQLVTASSAFPGVFTGLNAPVEVSALTFPTDTVEVALWIDGDIAPVTVSKVIARTTEYYARSWYIYCNYVDSETGTRTYDASITSTYDWVTSCYGSMPSLSGWSGPDRYIWVAAGGTRVTPTLTAVAKSVIYKDMFLVNVAGGLGEIAFSSPVRIKDAIAFK